MTQVIWPLLFNRIRGGVVNNTFGRAVRHNKDGSLRPHQGWDLETPRGMTCYAIADGRIVNTSITVSDKGYGMSVTLKFSWNGQTRYAFYSHLSQVMVSEGQPVAVGTPLGRVGVTGNAVHVERRDSLSLLALPRKQDHLHFEIRSVAHPGAGLHGRIDPTQIYGLCPRDCPMVQLRP
jgi:peptidoglycan LD-endopeptidase LytH